MGQLEAFEKGIQGKDTSFKGKTPGTREGALPTSQLHAQGADKKFSTDAGHSTLDLDGQTPKSYQKPLDTADNF